jgi:hypothetical protein
MGNAVDAAALLISDGNVIFVYNRFCANVFARSPIQGFVLCPPFRFRWVGMVTPAVNDVEAVPLAKSGFVARRISRGLQRRTSNAIQGSPMQRLGSHRGYVFPSSAAAWDGGSAPRSHCVKRNSSFGHRCGIEISVSNLNSSEYYSTQMQANVNSNDAKDVVE